MADEDRGQQTTPPTILLIEDDLLLINMYTKKFEIEGFKVLSAPNGEEGLRIAIEEDVDIILLDMMLPRVKGTDLLETLRQSKKAKDIPVIALTNLAQEDLRKKALELGVKEFLVKAQQTPEEVVEIVKKYVLS